jgi:hypothetical protein
MHTDCGKIPYPNPASAWRTLHSLSQPIALLSHKRLHKRCRIYRCARCHAWHLTHHLPLKRPEPVDPLHTAKRLNRQRLMMLEEAR